VNPEKIPSWLLWPLTFPYGAATWLRATLYRAGILRRKQLDGVVISVGNLTVGGTGKTPMVLWLAQRLAADGKPCAILTRGYRGQVSPEGNTSDEAQLLRSRLGDRVVVGVGADRFACGRELQGRGVHYFVLDDGFQHMQLARDVDILMVDATNPFGGRLLPAGRRREPLTALGRADIIVIMRSAHAPALEAAIRRDSRAAIFYARPDLVAIRKLCTDETHREDANIDAASLHARKFFVFCGIGNPSAFVADLQRWRLQAVGHKPFRDHHRYQQRDIEALVQEARAVGADALLCTEKDSFNLGEVKTSSMDLFYCTISLNVDRGDEFWRSVMAIADEKHAFRRKRR
jgi:tetraacyldisaccharide 4'-kinase